MSCLEGPQEEKEEKITDHFTYFISGTKNYVNALDEQGSDFREKLASRMLDL